MTNEVSSTCSVCLKKVGETKSNFLSGLKSLLSRSFFVSLLDLFRNAYHNKSNEKQTYPQALRQNSSLVLQLLMTKTERASLSVL